MTYYAREWNALYRIVQDFFLGEIHKYPTDLVSQKNFGHRVFHHYKPNELPVVVAQAFVEAGLNLMSGTLLCSKPRDMGWVHQDGRVCALNVPVQGTDRGIVTWFDGEFEASKFDDVSRGGAVKVALCEVETRTHMPISKAVCSTRLTQPMLLDINKWHRVDNTDNPEYRYVASFRFGDNPPLPEVLEKIKLMEKNNES